MLTVPAPFTDCDPWLTNFQKILTDGDPEGTGQFLEVPYQSLLPDIVKLQTRVATQQVMAPLKAYDRPETPEDDREKTFLYIFDTTHGAGAEDHRRRSPCICAICRRTSSPGSTACIRTT